LPFVVTPSSVFSLVPPPLIPIVTELLFSTSCRDSTVRLPPTLSVRSLSALTTPPLTVVSSLLLIVILSAVKYLFVYVVLSRFRLDELLPSYNKTGQVKPCPYGVFRY
jgi:hypothetical protein